MSGLDLCECAAEGDVDGVRTLLHKKNVNVNSRDESNWTALHNACYNGDTDMIMLLLTQDGVDVNATDNSGTTPFMNAALSGNLEAVRMMLSANIDIKKKDNNGKMAMDYAKERGVEDVYKLVKKETSLAMKVKKGAARLSQRMTGSRKK